MRTFKGGRVRNEAVKQNLKPRRVIRTDVHEKFVDVGRSLSGSLDEQDGVVVGVLLSLLDGDCSVLSEIYLVSDERDDNVRIGLLLELLDPVLGLFEGLWEGNVVHYNCGCLMIVVRRD